MNEASAPVSPHTKHRSTDPATSRRAALAAYPRAGSQRERILTAISAAPEGLTYDAVAEQTKIIGVSASTRISELAAGGWIEAAGERETEAGGMATVWKATLRDASPSSCGGAGDDRADLAVGSLASRSVTAVAPFSPGEPPEPPSHPAEGGSPLSLFELPPKKPEWS